MTSSVVAPSVGPRRARSGPFGTQRPRIATVPPSVSSAGQEAADLAAQAGLILDPWQVWVLDQSLGETADGLWAAFEVGLIVSRQNGKGSILEARELAGLLLFDEQLILHSAHEFKTAVEAFRRLRMLIDQTPHLKRRVSRVVQSTNEMGIELTTGQRVRFIARSGGSGRGFTGDLVILDEAYNLDAEAMEAVLPTLSARPNPQVWYTSSAGKDTSTQLGRVRARGVAGGDPDLAFFEWSIRAKLLGDEVNDDPADPTNWASANPALGYRITTQYMARELSALGVDSFAKERLAVTAYPVDDAQRWEVIPEAHWNTTLQPGATLGEALALAIDTTPDHGWTSVAAVGEREDGGIHAELIEHREGTAWVADRVVELNDRWSPCAIALDGAGPAGVLLADLEAAGIEVTQPTAREFGQACGGILVAFRDTAISHLDQEPLRLAIAGARKRPLGDAWAWARRDTAVDISPLVAVTLAAHAFELFGAMPTIYV